MSKLPSNSDENLIINSIMAAKTGPELRGVLTKKGNRKWLKSSKELQSYYYDKLEYFKKNWWPYDSFIQSMVTNLKEDFEIEMMDDYLEETVKISDNYSILSKTHSNDDIFYSKKIVELKELPLRNIIKISLLDSTKENIWEETEYELVRIALIMSNGNRSDAANLLGIAVRTLRNKLNKYKEEGDFELADQKISENVLEDKDPAILMVHIRKLQETIKNLKRTIKDDLEKQCL